MLNRIEFRNFRGFKQLELTGLSQITLLTGKNGAGKSSVLEGVFSLMGFSLPDAFDRIRNLRGLPAASDITKLWEPVFYNLDTTQPLQISAEFNGMPIHLKYVRDDSFSSVDALQNVQNTFITFTNPANTNYALQYSYLAGSDSESGHLFLNQNGAFAMALDTGFKQHLNPLAPNTLFVKSASANSIDDADLASWFGDLELTGEKQLVIDALRIIDPTIVDVKTIVQRRYVQLYVITKESSLPVKLSGDGMCKLIYLVLAVLQNRDSIVLIDEIENGFHYSMQEKFWKILSETANRSNTQIIATTHSYECINHAVNGILQANMLNDFCLFRIEKSGDSSRVARYSGNLLMNAMDSSMEVR